MTMSMMVHLLGGLTLLIFGGQAVVKSAAAIGMRMGLSALATGLTIVAFGTSAPELLVNLRAAEMGAGAMAVGNVVGSNIANIGLVLGVSVLIKPLTLDLKVIRNDIYMMIAAGLLAAAFLAMGQLDRLQGLIFVALIVAYVGYNLRASKTVQTDTQERFEEALSPRDWSAGVDVLLGIFGIAALVFGADLFVKGAVELAKNIGVSPELIGLTVVAIGTSLPELATTAIAAYRGYGDMAIGNIVGSNIFNILSVLGVTALFYPLDRGEIGNADLLMFLLSALVLMRFIQTGSRMDRWEGGVLLSGFCAYLIGRLG